jgi:hypothetical protein
MCLLLAIAQSVVGYAESHKRETITPFEIALSTRTRKESEVVRILFSDQKNWSTLRGGIESGDHAWIEVGLMLLPHSEGGARHELRVAFEEALAANPIAVIGSIHNAGSNLKIVCGPSAYAEYDRAEDSIDRRLRAVGGVIAGENPNTMSLRPLLTLCAVTLDEAELALKKRN